MFQFDGKLFRLTLYFCLFLYWIFECELFEVTRRWVYFIDIWSGVGHSLSSPHGVEVWRDRRA